MATKPISELFGGVTRFGRLTVIGEGEPVAWRDRTFRRAKCLCDCGEIRSVQIPKLKSGQTVSCGCYAAERASRENRTHGRSRTPEYTSWRSMIQRCENPKATDYEIYGGRGVKICDRWRNSFEAFLADMGPRPAGNTLDRIDHTGDYEPSNCRWATAKAQTANRSNMNSHEIDGELLNLSEAEKRFGVTRKTLRQRIKQGMTLAEAVGAS